jgi:CMP-N,N'-diacetyllegionaminic acid synthase
MIHNKKVVGLITARGGSKGVPGKNIIELGGKPLIAWSIQTALQSRYIDRLILSSDDEDIISIAEDFGCEAPFRRPVELANDTASSVDVARHALTRLEEKFDYLVLLQPTSPFRLASDIDECLDLCLSRGAPAAVTVTKADKPPAWMFELDTEQYLQSVLPTPSTATRRQDLKEIYALNGAVFIVRIDGFRETNSFLPRGTVGKIMPIERSLDIDTAQDLFIARALANSPDYFASI